MCVCCAAAAGGHLVIHKGVLFAVVIVVVVVPLQGAGCCLLLLLLFLLLLSKLRRFVRFVLFVCDGSRTEKAAVFVSFARKFAQIEQKKHENTRNLPHSLPDATFVERNTLHCVSLDQSVAVERYTMKCVSLDEMCLTPNIQPIWLNIQREVHFKTSRMLYVHTTFLKFSHTRSVGSICEIIL